MMVCWLLSLSTSASAGAALPRPPPPGPPIIGSIMSFRSPAGCLRRRRTRASAAGPGGFYSINGGFRVRGQVRPTIQVVAGRLEVEHQRRRSEEHTSELQSLMRISYAVFCLKQKKDKNISTY